MARSIGRRTVLVRGARGLAALVAVFAFPRRALGAPGGNGRGQGGGGGGGDGTQDSLIFGTAAGAPLEWRIKSSSSRVGPGPNFFSNRTDDVFVRDGRLHLTITKHGSRWYATEVISAAPVGYGLFEFWLESAVDALEPNAVLGLFTWNDDAADAHREIDLEFTRWANAAAATNAQYTVQPYSDSGHLHAFVWPPRAPSYHRIRWLPGEVQFASFAEVGGGALELIESWSYSGADVPAPEDPAGPGARTNARMNLWLYHGPPSGRARVEVVVRDFAYTPA